jgi:predicted  nucleic acid-binding Zn-ribbon protein
MLSNILKDHQAKQAKLKEINDQNRKAALAATESVVNLMGDSIGDSMADVFVAEKKLEKEAKGLQTNTAHFSRQTHQWLDMVKQFNNNLKVRLSFIHSFVDRLL